jgi:hypothetical protein
MPPTTLLRAGCGAALASCAWGAAMLEDQSGPWEAATLGSSLSATWHDAFPQELFDAVVAETDVFHEYDEAKAARSPQMMHGKRPTWWFKVKGEDGQLRKPRCAIEAAIRRLHDIDFPGGGHARVVGGEWWMQTRTPAETIGFHYDKDEAFASLHMTMRYPEVSTVTYLTKTGAPTLILNQTTPDGNTEVPEIPVLGRLVYPVPNKHLAFRGNLQHGVAGSMSVTKGASNKRRTLLVNWWTEKPMPPNCVDLDDDTLDEIGLNDAAKTHALRVKLGLLTPGSAEAASEDAAATAAYRSPPEAGAWTALDPPPRSAEELAEGGATSARASRLLNVEIPPKENLFFEMPVEAERAVGDWEMRWAAGESAFGHVQTMDLDHPGAMNQMWNSRKVKALFFGSKAQWVEAQTYMLPLAMAQHAEVFFIWADPSSCADAAETFGLAQKDYPTFAMHQTHGSGGEEMYTLADNSGGKGGAPSKAAVTEMLAGYFAGKLKPVPEEGEL